MSNFALLHAVGRAETFVDCARLPSKTAWTRALIRISFGLRLTEVRSRGPCGVGGRPSYAPQSRRPPTVNGLARGAICAL